MRACVCLIIPTPGEHMVGSGRGQNRSRSGGPGIYSREERRGKTCSADLGCVEPRVCGRGIAIIGVLLVPAVWL